jgi:hypothetical protein
LILLLPELEVLLTSQLLGISAYYYKYIVKYLLWVPDMELRLPFIIFLSHTLRTL